MTPHAAPQTVIDHCISLLHRIIPAWPKPHRSDVDDIRRKLGQFLAKNFDEIDFLNKIDRVAEIVDSSENEGRVAVEFLDADGSVNRAVFSRQHRADEWRLEALKFQCPACFGSGINDGVECPLCGGAGWGAS